MSAVPSPAHLDDLDAALELTHALRARVEAGEFEAAAGLECARRAHLERYFATRPAASELPHALARLRELVAANDALVGLAEHQQRALAREADTLGTGRRAVLAYAVNAG